VSGNLSCWESKDLFAVDFLNDPDGPGWRLSRPDFDGWLLGEAVASGARLVHSVWPNCAISAQFVVDATGRGSIVARRSGALRVRCPHRLATVYAIGQPGSTSFDRTIVEAVPQGWWYGCVLPDECPLIALQVAPRDVLKVRRQFVELLAETIHIKHFFANARFAAPTRVVESGGSRLNHVFGPEWVACGDAALAFDPLSSQGIYTALYTGMQAARAVQGAAFATYAARLEEIWRYYQDRVLNEYQVVRRWPQAEFWRARLEVLHRAPVPEPAQRGFVSFL
jgi:flavin-dependent dehydrogenase